MRLLVKLEAMKYQEYDEHFEAHKMQGCYMDSAQRRIIEFGLDCGFGERNTMGYGFVNVYENRRRS